MSFRNSKVLITGATGLIGKAIVNQLRARDAVIIALVRNLEKAVQLFGPESEKMHYIVGDVTAFVPQELGVDYIIHGASRTASKDFVNAPVETIMTGLMGTIHMLETAKLNKVKGFVYLSSMEVYGSPFTDEKIDEKHGTNLDTMEVRSSYPESKRMCENLCCSYASEYNVPAKVIRLTQTFGPGVLYNDGRVFAEFARAAIEEKDIVLHTKGETRRNYLYIDDAADAVLRVLKYGEAGQAYNAANEETYCSIYDMAGFVADKCAEGKIKVLIREENADKHGYAPVLHMNLDTKKLQGLNWKPACGIEDMFNRMIDDMKMQAAIKN